MFTSEGDFWRKNSSYCSRRFTAGVIARFGETMVDYAEAAAGDMRPGEVRNVHADLSRLTLLIACKTLFDADVRGQASEVARALEHLQDATTELIDQKHTPAGVGADAGEAASAGVGGDAGPDRVRDHRGAA